MTALTVAEEKTTSQLVAKINILNMHELYFWDPDNRTRRKKLGEVHASVQW